VRFGHTRHLLNGAAVFDARFVILFRGKILVAPGEMCAAGSLRVVAPTESPGEEDDCDETTSVRSRGHDLRAITQESGLDCLFVKNVNGMPAAGRADPQGTNVSPKAVFGAIAPGGSEG
jgi:hypothetical protein